MTPDTEQVQRALKNDLGERLSQAVAQEAAAALGSWRREGLETVEQRVETALFRGLYRELGVTMLYVDDAGRQRRVTTDDLPELTDCVMGTLFAAMRPSAEGYELLHDYAMRTGSLRAMSEMYRRYQSYSGAEHEILGQVLRDRYGRHTPDWLKMPE